MATHRRKSNDRVGADLARLFSLLKRLDVFQGDKHVINDKIRKAILNWKVKAFGLK